MGSKLLTFVAMQNDTVVKRRIFWRDGICTKPDALQEVLADNSGYNWLSVRTKGITFVEPQSRRRMKSRKMNPNLPEFLGLQVAVKQEKEIIMDETGQPVVSLRKKRVGLSPENLAAIKVASEAGKTFNEASTELGLPVALIRYTAKKQGLTFKAGKRGRAKGEVKAVDPELLAKVKAVVEAGKTVSEAKTELGVSAAILKGVATKAGLVFVKGKAFGGRVSKDHTVLVEAMKAQTHLTMKEASLTLNESVSTLAYLAKKNGITFKAGVKGRQKKVVELVAA